MCSAKYNDKFGIKKHSRKPTDKQIRAFSQVADIRKFEIDMYWKRATYFWTIIAVTFTGFFALSTAKEIPHQNIFSLLLSSMGMVFTFSWYLVNRGSKYWQENWENHLDHMEDNITGPLYKTVLERPKRDELKSFKNKESNNKTDNKDNKDNKDKFDWIDHVFTGPRKLSVSKINQWVAMYVFSIWGFLVAISAFKIFPSIREHIVLSDIHAAIGILVLSGLAMTLMLRKGKQYSGKQLSKIKPRESEII